MNLSAEVIQMLVMFGGVAAVYGGIRADLRGMHSRIQNAENDIEAGRVRMDNHIERTLIERVH
jgi:hypothetical protein